MVKTYLNLNKKSSSDILITLFFRAGIFVKRGSEKELLELVLEEINRDSKIIYHYITNRELKELKERGFFNNSPLVSDSPFDVYSNEDLENEFKKKIFEEVFIYEGNNIRASQKYLEGLMKEVPFLARNSRGMIYLKNNKAELKRSCLREYFHLISELRKIELIQDL